MAPKTLLRCIAILASVSYPAGAILAQVPIERRQMIVDYLAPPLTLNDTVHSADAIIVGTVVSKRLFSLDPADPVRTVYSIKVDDVIKPHEFLSALMDVYRDGGDWIVGSRIKRTEEIGFPAYGIGSQYVICLAYNQYARMFQSRFGPDGSYLLTGSAVRPMGTSPLALAQADRAPADFIRSLKTATGPQ